MRLPFDVTEAELRECESMIDTHWRGVVGAYTVRLALAPLVEAYILLDRMLYLYEHGKLAVLSKHIANLSLPPSFYCNHRL